jgi:hypothetical protein
MKKSSSWNVALAATVIGALRIFSASSSTSPARPAPTTEQVQVLNGLSAPVEVAFSGHPPLIVQPGGRAHLALASGPTWVEVRRGEKVIAREVVAIPSGQGFIAYNVLGAAPLYRLRVRSSAQQAKAARPDVEPLAGNTLVFGSEDAIFEDLPEALSSNRNGPDPTRPRVAVAGGARWRSAAQMLLAHERYADAARMLRQVLSVEDDALGAAAFAIDRSAGPAQALAFLQGKIQERPDWYDAHRLFQWHTRVNEGVEKARAFYRARVEAHPDSAFERLLLAGVDESRAAEAALRALLKTSPGDARAARCLAVVLARAQRWKEAADLLAKAPEDGEEAEAYADLQIEALAGAGRAQVAFELAMSRLRRAPNTAELIEAAQVARLIEGGGKAAALIDEFEPKVSEPQLARLFTGELTHGEDSRAAKFARALVSGPSEAWDALGRAEQKELAELGDAALLLLATEFHRMGDAARADALYRVRSQPLPAAAAYAYVERGEEGADFAMTEPRTRAALYLARALAVEADGRDGAALRALAKRADVLRGPIARAAERWSKGVRPASAVKDEPVVVVRVRR